MITEITAEHTKHYQIIARWLCYGDLDLADDILQEIYVAVLDSGVTEWWELKLLAKSRAIDYLLSRRHNYSQDNRFKHISIEAMMDAGVQIDTDCNVLLPRNFNKLEVGNEVMELFS